MLDCLLYLAVVSWVKKVRGPASCGFLTLLILTLLISNRDRVLKILIFAKIFPKSGFRFVFLDENFRFFDKNIIFQQSII